MQNDAVTSGNDVFLVCFWTLHVNASYLRAAEHACSHSCCLRTSFAACYATANEFGLVWYMDVFSWMCMMFLQQRFAWFSTANDVFGEELRFAFCLEAARCFFVNV